MEPPVGRSADDLIDEKVQVLRADPHADARTMSCAASSTAISTSPAWRRTRRSRPSRRCASFVDTWRWQDVPFFIRAGKNMPVHVTEVVVRLKRPPLDVFDPIKPADQNYVRFRIDPQVVIAIGAQRKAGRRRHDRRTGGADARSTTARATCRPMSG